MKSKLQADLISYQIGRENMRLYRRQYCADRLLLKFAIKHYYRKEHLSNRATCVDEQEKTPANISKRL